MINFLKGKINSVSRFKGREKTFLAGFSSKNHLIMAEVTLSTASTIMSATASSSSESTGKRPWKIRKKVLNGFAKIHPRKKAGRPPACLTLIAYIFTKPWPSREPFNPFSSLDHLTCPCLGNVPYCLLRIYEL